MVGWAEFLPTSVTLPKFNETLFSLNKHLFYQLSYETMLYSQPPSFKTPPNPTIQIYTTMLPRCAWPHGEGTLKVKADSRVQRWQAGLSSVCLVRVAAIDVRARR